MAGRRCVAAVAFIGALGLAGGALAAQAAAEPDGAWRLAGYSVR